MQMLDTSTRKSLYIGAAVMFSLAVLRSTLFAAVIPPLHGPDEPAHFDYVQRLGEHGRLPEFSTGCQAYSKEIRAGDVALLIGFAFNPSRPIPPLVEVNMPDPADPASRATKGCGPAATYPPAYYATLVLGYLANAEDSFFTRLFSARMISSLWGGLTAVAAFFAGIFFFRRLWDGVLLGLLAVVQPMFGFLSAVVNNDAALFACSTGCFAAIAALRAISRPRMALVALALFATVGVLSKSTFFLCLPILFVFCAAALGPWSKRSWLLAAAVMALPAAAAAAWTLAWPGGTGGVFEAQVARVSISEFLSRYVFEWERIRWLWVHMYWMTWGWVDTNLPRPFFDVLLGIFALAGAGLVLGWRKASPDERGVIVLGIAGTFGFVFLLYVLEFLVLRRTGNVFIQGRYLLPFFAVHGVLLILGLRWLSRVVRAPFSAPWVMLAFLVLVNVAAYFRALARFHA